MLTRLFKSDYGRYALLNTPLLLVLGCAWVADRWPQWTLVTIITAFAIIIAEIGVLYFAAKQSQLAAKTEAAISALTLIESVEDARIKSIEEALEVRNNFEKDILNLLRRDQGFLHEHSLYEHRMRVRASQSTTWAMATVTESVLRDIARPQALKRSSPIIPRELAKWEFAIFGDEAFNVAAGPVQIEHFHGTTNIRILDPSRVTVEGPETPKEKKLAGKSDAAWLRPPVYQ